MFDRTTVPTRLRARTEQVQSGTDDPRRARMLVGPAPTSPPDSTSELNDRGPNEQCRNADGRRARRTCTGPVVVAIPAHDEEATIGEVVSTAATHADCVVVIDDGSDDDTAERARQAGATVVEHASNEGYGAALVSAFRAARNRGASHLVTLDGDGQHDTDDVPRLIDEQHRTNAEIVIASRFVDGSAHDVPLYRRFGLRAIGFLMNAALSSESSRSWISDTQSGFRAYDEQAIDSLAADETIAAGMGASVEVLHHGRRHGYEIAEIGTKISYDVESPNGENPILHGLSVVRSILASIGRSSRRVR